MRELRTAIEIEATPARIWEILTDFDSYSEWNPFVRNISGQAVRGTQLEVRIEPPGGRGMSFKPTVLEAEPERELRWLGRLLVPGIFDGEHSSAFPLRAPHGLSRKGGYWSVTNTKAYAVTRLPQRSTPSTKSNRPRG
jgi:hypothetical protein